MLYNIIFVAAGFALLIKGADYLVDGASSVAKRFGVSSLVIGLTVVAFGTSAPELAVNVLAAINGGSEIALGNVNGSNVANILLILGVASWFGAISLKSRTVVKEVPYMLLAGAVLIILVADGALNGSSEILLSRSDGLILLSFFVIFMYYLFLSAMDAAGPAKEEKAKHSFPISIGFTVMGLAGLILGGFLTVQGATGIAISLGVSQTLIGLTVVALGTSLPELVSAVVAVKKGQSDIAVGGVVGSVIFNILLVLGLTATITPIAVSLDNVFDALVVFVAMALFFIFVFVNVTHARPARGIDKYEGMVFLLTYLVYIAYTIFRG